MMGFVVPSRNDASVTYRLLGMIFTLLLLSHVGCRQRAVTELYVEQMAQRNRALEDLVYDFDAENRAMEFEIEDLRRTNARLQGRLQELQRQSARVERLDSSPSNLPSNAPPSSSPSDRKTPTPLKIPPTKSKEQESLKLEPPEIIIPKKSGDLVPPLSSEPILPAPEPLIKESLPEELLPKEPLLPPANPPAAPKESLLKPAPSGLPSSGSDGALENRKIQLPATGVIQTSATKSKPIDPRVRQIDWHPTMCRSQNTDGKPGDDGLYLVLIPRNFAGDFVPTTGSLTLVVEETLADGSVVRIGRYEYKSEELKEHLEPVGSAPGLHLSIPWSEATPSTASVEVFAKYTLDDGTTMVNRRTIPLRRSATSGASNWMPR
jgi:hypothetical protein